jgi:tetratricopeptide (TPR) repeat protein
MKLTTTALGVILALSAVPATAQLTRQMSQDDVEKANPKQQNGEPQLQPSNGALKAIVDLQTSVNANDYASVPAKVAAAQKVAKTPVDRYLISQLQLKAALAAKDNAGIATAIDGVANSGYVDKAKASGLYQSLGASLYNDKQFPQAAAAFQKAIAANPNDPEALAMLGESQNAQGQKAEAISSFQRALQVSSAAGTKPREEMYKRAVGLAYNAKASAAIELGRQWIAAYPNADSWKNGIAIYRNLSSPDVEGTLDLLRLMQATGSLTSQSDYNLYATAAADQANYPEAQAVIDAGIAAKVVDPASPIFRDTVAGLKAKQKLTDADLAEAVKAATTGAQMIRVGDRYFGMGQYAKAADLYRQGIAKGPADADVANLHLGMALARAGDKAGATAAFNAVKGTRADIAKYWLLYVQTHG